MLITTQLFTFRIHLTHGLILMTVGNGLALLLQMSFIALKMQYLKLMMGLLPCHHSGLQEQVNRAFRLYLTLHLLHQVTRIQHSTLYGMLGLLEILLRQFHSKLANLFGSPSMEIRKTDLFSQSSLLIPMATRTCLTLSWITDGMASILVKRDFHVLMRKFLLTEFM